MQTIPTIPCLLSAISRVRMFAMFVCCVVLYPPSPISTRVTRTTRRIKKSLHTIQTIDWTNSSQCFLCLLSNCQRFLGCLEWFSCGVKTSHGRHLVTWHPQPVTVIAWVNIYQKSILFQQLFHKLPTVFNENALCLSKTTAAKPHICLYLY